MAGQHILLNNNNNSANSVPHNCHAQRHPLSGRHSLLGAVSAREFALNRNSLCERSVCGRRHHHPLERPHRARSAATYLCLCVALVYGLQTTPECNWVSTGTKHSFTRPDDDDDADAGDDNNDDAAGDDDGKPMRCGGDDEVYAGVRVHVCVRHMKLILDKKPSQ